LFFDFIKRINRLHPLNRLDTKPINEALVGWRRKSGGWLSGEMWLKLAGLR